VKIAQVLILPGSSGADQEIAAAEKYLFFSKL
jgi:hypothetical protein